MIQLTAPTTTRPVTANATTSATPSAVIAARVISILHGAVLVVAGLALATTPGAEVFGVGAVVEGAARIALAISLRRGARRVRMAMLVLTSIGVFVGAFAGGIYYIGAAINGAVVRCLMNDDAKEFLTA